MRDPLRNMRCSVLDVGINAGTSDSAELAGLLLCALLGFSGDQKCVVDNYEARKSLPQSAS